VSISLAVNPVLSRELRQRVRSRRATAVLTVYLSLLVAGVALLVWGLDRSTDAGSGAGQGIGRTLFGSLLFGSLGLVCFIVPGVAAGAVAGERERLTLVPLQVTLLTPGQVLRGKLLASLAFTTLLLVATLPLLAVAYVLGGVTVAQILGGLFFVLASSAFIGVLSIWASTVLRRVQRATVASYGLVGLLVLGTPIAYGVQILATSSFVDDDGSSSRWESLLFLAPNPFMVTADALGHQSAGGPSPFTPSQDALRRRDERRSGFGGFDDPFGPDIAVAEPVPFNRNGVIIVPPPAPVPGPPPFAVTTVPAPAVVPTTAFVRDPTVGPVTTFPSGVQVFPGEQTQPGPLLPGFDPSSGMIIDESGNRFGQERERSDFTDRGPIWAWTFGWWVLIGGAAYGHAARKLRLPSQAGVRP
jgi:ABC-2 type transport system permease protein